MSCRVQNLESVTAYYNSYTNNWYGQTFVPDFDFSLYSVSIYAYKAGTPGSVTLKVYATSGGLPTGSALVSSSATDPSSWTSAGWRELTLTSALSVTSGTTYAFVIENTGDASTNYIRWAYTTTADYITFYTGRNVLWNGSTWSAPATEADMNFRLSSAGTEYESNIGSADASDNIFGANWSGQTFTPTTTHKCSIVLAILYRFGSPASVTCQIRTTDGDGKPTTAVLGTATNSNAANLPLASQAIYTPFYFSSGVQLTANTKYAIVFSCSSGDGSNYVLAGLDISSPAYTGGSECFSTNSGNTWSLTTARDYTGFIEGTGPVSYSPALKTYSRQLVAIGTDEIWYEPSAGTIAELSTANGTINTGLPLEATEAFQKLFIVNGSNKKVLDFSNTKIATADLVGSPNEYPERGITLAGGTSGAQMIVDYIDAEDSATNVYGYRTTTGTFISGETVTGTNSDAGTVSFVLSAAETAPPHWYNWTVYGNDTTNYGTMPSTPTLVCLYRGRIILAGDSTLPHAWWMTKVGDPFKVKYDFTNDGSLSAVTHTNTTVGKIGDIVSALIPYKDDLLIFGCVNSLWLLVGDPMAEGQLARITDATGIWGSRAWCMDDKNNLYFFGNDGVYRMPVSETVSPPENITKLQLPTLVKDWDLDKDLHRIVVSFDPINYGILVTKTTLADGTCVGYWFDLTTQGWFPESYHSSCGIFSSYFYPATDETYKKFVIGCEDGYIREFDWSTKNDATTSSTTAIDSYLAIIKQLSDADNKNGMLQTMNIVLAGGASSGDFSDTDGLSYALYKADDAETALENIIDADTAFLSGSWTGTGEKNRINPRMRGTWAGIKLYNSTASQTFAIEKLYADIFNLGEK